jgi:predicted Fe-Mo cluster-binding NifX family protein
MVKVCLPTMGDRGMEEDVSAHFGRAPTFTVVDLDTGAVKVVPNTGEHMGGKGHAGELLLKEGAQVMIAGNLGPRAVELFQQSGIEVFTCATGTVREAIEDWKAGMLTVADAENACLEHRH